MSGNTHKGKAPVIQGPTNISAQLTITAFNDGTPMQFRCSADLPGTLKLVGAGLITLANSLQPVNAQADPVDKKREYLGPREE